jgi:hypothetical protein
MLIAITVISIAVLFAALTGIVIHQKALAFRDLRENDEALNNFALGGRHSVRRPLQATSTRTRKVAVSRRKVEHACEHHA